MNLHDDQGVEHWINPAFVLSVRARARTELGATIRFSNGTTMNVQESKCEVVKQILDLDSSESLEQVTS